MRTCPSCGGSSPSGAEWCGLCFASLGAPAAAVVVAAAAPLAAAAPRFVTPAAATAVAPPGRFVPVSPVVPAAPAPDDAPLLRGRALLLVAIAIGVGAVGMALSWVLSRDENLEPEAYIRYAILITLGIYVVVAALLATQLGPNVRLRWRVGSPAGGIAFGALVGGGLSAALLVGVSAAAGHLSPDPRIVTMMSEGDAAHLVITVLISCVCAPLIEEVLFRGLLLESMRRHGTRVAVLVSGVAFAIWHLNPSALRYYALMGGMLGLLYVKRGLICSISAHAAFNSVLAVAALALVLAPAKLVTAGHVSLRAPGGWTTAHAEESHAAIALAGPSGASLLVVDVPTVDAPSVDTVIRRIQAGLLGQAFPSVTVETSTTRQVTLPAGPAAEVDVTAQGHRGTIVFLPLRGEAINVVFVSGGSMKAQSDFPRILDSLRVN